MGLYRGQKVTAVQATTSHSPSSSNCSHLGRLVLTQYVSEDRKGGGSRVCREDAIRGWKCTIAWDSAVNGNGESDHEPQVDPAIPFRQASTQRHSKYSDCSRTQRIDIISPANMEHCIYRKPATEGRGGDACGRPAVHQRRSAFPALLC